MHALVSLHNASYQPLANRTWDQNKLLYASQHNYAAELRTDNFLGGISIGYEKIWFIKQLMEQHPEYEWLWWTGTDAMITNFNIRIEDRIDNNYHFIIATDCHGINADSYLIRNTPEGRAYNDYIWGQRDRYAGHVWQEQQCIIESQDQFNDIIKIVPQRDINAYQYNLYPTEPFVDFLGTNGNWQKNDWLIQWPGTTLPSRIQLADYYLTQVTK
jgi:hypothetical protein